MPWERQGQDIEDFPHLKRWLATIKARPAVERAYELAKRINDAPAIHDEKSRKVLFEQDQNRQVGHTRKPKSA